MTLGPVHVGEAWFHEMLYFCIVRSIVTRARSHGNSNNGVGMSRDNDQCSVVSVT